MDMDRKIVVNESKVFDACALIEEIVKQLVSTSCPKGMVMPFVMEKASQASLLLNQAMEEGELYEENCGSLD